MLVEKKSSQKRTQILIGIILILLVVAAAVLYQAFYGIDPSLTVAPVDADAEIALSEIEVIDPHLETGFLTQSPYVLLRRYGADPLPIPEIGRDNPFLPIVTVTSTQSL